MSVSEKMTESEMDEFLQKCQLECSNNGANFSQVVAKKLMALNYSLHWALDFKDVAIIKYMLDNGYYVNERSLSRSTPLHVAVKISNLDTIKLLVDRGAKLNIQNFDHNTPLELLAELLNDKDEKLEIFDFLLERGAPFPLKKMDILFARADKSVIIKMLLKYGEYLIEDGSLPCNLQQAIAGNVSFDPLELLKSQKLDINQRYRRHTILMRAASAGNVNTVEYLLNHGAEVNAIFGNYTALLKPFIPNLHHTQPTRNFLKIIELLLQYGADPQYKHCHAIFRIVICFNRFAFIKPYLAHLALIENQGVTIRQDVRRSIDSHPMFIKYFDLCKRKIDKIKRTVVYHSVTLFKLLTVSEGKMTKYIQNDELLSRFKLIMYNKRRSNLYYYNVLRRRMKKVERIVNLQKIAYNFLCKKVGNIPIIVGIIIDYLSINDLEIMSQV